MNCPKCGHVQSCPCPACQARNLTEKPWIDIEGVASACGNCGYTLSNDDWDSMDSNTEEDT